MSEPRDELVPEEDKPRSKPTSLDERRRMIEEYVEDLRAIIIRLRKRLN
jgi:hypothetical protein